MFTMDDYLWVVGLRVTFLLYNILHFLNTINLEHRFWSQRSFPLSLWGSPITSLSLYSSSTLNWDSQYYPRVIVRIKQNHAYKTFRAGLGHCKNAWNISYHPLFSLHLYLHILYNDINPNLRLRLHHPGRDSNIPLLLLTFLVFLLENG